MKDITVKTILCNILEILSGFFFLACTVIVLVNVFLRYFLHTGITWSEEVCTACFVWGAYVGAAACFKRKMHLGVDVLVNKLPEGGRKIAAVIVDLITLVLNAYITYQSYVYVSLSYTKPTPVLGVSSAYISSSIVFSFAAMTIFSIIFVVKDIKILMNREEQV